MTINANTTIASILKQDPAALEAIISISPKFEKLRNPILRKLMAGRSSIAMASKIAGCAQDAFFEKLRPLGFTIDALTTAVIEQNKTVPDFIKLLKADQLVELDVRPIIASGNDPLNLITKIVTTIKPGQALKIINSFSPVPLMKLLEKKGFVVYQETVNEDQIVTYFYKETIESEITATLQIHDGIGWDDAVQQFTGKLQVIDVRMMEMPQPMLTILDALDKLADGVALFVYHKRIPVFLLPELAERKFDYRIKEISDGEVRLLIFKA